ncbi:hypothetical protein ACF0H5_003238 [Mactra antiquata]
MDLKLSLLLLLCVVYVRSGYRDDDDDDHHIAAMIRHQGMKVLKLSDKVDELKSFLAETFGHRLQRIEELVTSLEKRELLREMCTDTVCGQHGTCDISTDLTSTICHCEEGYEGAICNKSVKCSIAHHYVMSGTLMPGMQIPQCEEDGSYKPVQFRGSGSFCVTKDDGYEIYGFDVPIWESPEDRTCQCARDHDADLNETPNFISRCNRYGDYLPHRCDDTGCICQDSHGNTYGERRSLGDLQVLQC